jgi:hypothetical protein
MRLGNRSRVKSLLIIALMTASSLSRASGQEITASHLLAPLNTAQMCKVIPTPPGDSVTHLYRFMTLDSVAESSYSSAFDSAGVPLFLMVTRFVPRAQGGIVAYALAANFRSPDSSVYGGAEIDSLGTTLPVSAPMQRRLLTPHEWALARALAVSLWDRRCAPRDPGD